MRTLFLVTSGVKTRKHVQITGWGGDSESEERLQDYSTSHSNLKESPKMTTEEEIQMAKEKQQPVEEKQPKPYTKIMQEK